MGLTRTGSIRHTSVTDVVKTAQAHGTGLEEVLSLSRHSNVTTLMVYRDRERNVQGQLTGLVAGGVWGPDGLSNRDYRQQTYLSRYEPARTCCRSRG